MMNVLFWSMQQDPSLMSLAHALEVADRGGFFSDILRLICGSSLHLYRTFLFTFPRKLSKGNALKLSGGPCLAESPAESAHCTPSDKYHRELQAREQSSKVVLLHNCYAGHKDLLKQGYELRHAGTGTGCIPWVAECFVGQSVQRTKEMCETLSLTICPTLQCFVVSFEIFLESSLLLPEGRHSGVFSAVVQYDEGDCHSPKYAVGDALPQGIQDAYIQVEILSTCQCQA